MCFELLFQTMRVLPCKKTVVTKALQIKKMFDRFWRQYVCRCSVRISSTTAQRAWPWSDRTLSATSMWRKRSCTTCCQTGVLSLARSGQSLATVLTLSRYSINLFTFTVVLVSLCNEEILYYLITINNLKKENNKH